MLIVGFQISYADKYDNNIINISFTGSDTIVFLDKSQSLVDILSIENNRFKIIRSFDISPLKNLEKKNLAKEEGTPEGIYFINDEILLNDFNQPEKKVALVLNYPNAADKYNKRTGTDIWIQSKTSNQEENLSCFYLEESNFIELSKYIKVNKTPVIIIKNETSKSKIFKKALEWKEFLEQWKSTFSSKMLVDHSKLYIANNDQLNFDYANKINYILNSENPIYEFNLDNIIVLQSDEECRISFRFHFNSDSFQLDKQFSLGLLPVENEWKIFSENANYNPTIKLTDNEIIKNLVFQWKDTWETKNFNKFISLYSQNFSDDDRNYRQFSTSKQNAFQNLGEIKVSIKDIKIEELSNQYKVTFTQDYWTENYQDIGLKTLIFEKNNMNFLIVYESWSEIVEEQKEPVPQLPPKERIAFLINQYKTNWEDKNYSKYISLYSEDYADSNRSYHQFYDYKRNAFKNKNQIKVTIDSLKINDLNNQYNATFIQIYWTPDYQDIGLKTIIFNENFQIINEKWEEIKDIEKIESEEIRIEPEIQLPPKEHITKLIEHWRLSWESKNFQKYISLYSESYADDNRNYNEYYNYKRRSFRNQNSIKVSIKNLEIKEMGTRWIATFIQNYWTQDFSDVGNKSIIFNKDFKIIHESWEKISDITDEINLPPKEHIELLIEDWKQSWESKNFEKFISLYSETYADTNRTYREFYYYKRGSFKKNNNISVNISALKIEELNDSFLVTFTQEYSTTSYKDKGIKRIIFNKFGNKFLIVNETWEELFD